jgi:4-carboxymuconolactone decarboxylase
VANHAFGIATNILREKGLLPSAGSAPAAQAASK